MTLAAYVVPKREVTFRGGSFHVKGLSLDDVTILMGGYLNEIDNLFKLYDKEDTRETAVSESAKLAIGIVRESPAMIGTMIAICSGEPDQVEIARNLPLDVQIEALKAIIELTFEEAGGAKKFVDKILNLVRTIRPPMPGEV